MKYRRPKIAANHTGSVTAAALTPQRVAPPHDVQLERPPEQGTIDASNKVPAMHFGFEVLESNTAPIEIDQIPTSILARFDDLQFLGRGGMGSVYRGFDKQLTREAAIKFVHGTNAHRFLREARAQARVNHDNVCKIFDVGFAEGHPFIVMQLVRGEPLSVACKNMTLEEKIKAIRESAAALHEVHRLGLVHRDIKPSNIMVERDENGQWRPFVMDFGLARVAREAGETVTGHIAGTPAYMAPEQARGDIRGLDRRSDVYSLGATLYDIVTGRPPFVEDQSWQVLMRISTEDAPPLRSVWPNAPPDLEIVVMKCLERDPGRRYDSSRALGEDLQRYLDGEPIAARKGSVLYRFTKRARKHKLLVSLVLLGLVTIAIFVGLAIRSRRIAAQEAKIAQELGEDVKEMQLFMRYAHSLPAHDIERERAVIRKRLSEIEAKLTGVDSVGRAAGHYALGRGHLALQEPRKALEHLQTAQRLGYASPELEYALGRALVEIYREERESLRRIEDPTQREARKTELNAAYRAPVLEHLRAAKDSRLEHPAYVDGLIALTDERYDDALRLAKQAQNETPWFYEAILVEADAYAAMGEAVNYEFKFDYDSMVAHFTAAMDAYRRAAAVGSSDASVYEGACKVLFQWIYADSLTGRHESSKKHFEEGKEFGQQAIVADPRRTSLHLYRTRIYNSYYSHFSIAQDLEAGILETIRLAEAAAKARPSDAMAQWLFGNSWRRYSSHLKAQGRDSEEPTKRAIASYKEALALDANFVVPAREMAGLTLRLAIFADRHGEDWIPYLNEAARSYAHVWGVSPEAPFVPINKSNFLRWIAVNQFQRGIDPSTTLDDAQKYCAEAIARQPQNPAPKESCLLVANLRTEFALATGKDPTPFLTQQNELLTAMGLSNASQNETRALTLASFAHAKLRSGGSPEREALQALESFRGAGLDGLRQIGPALLTLLRWHVDRKTANGKMFDEYLKALAPLLEEACVEPEPFQLAAAIQERHAAWLLDDGRDPSETIAKGLAMVEATLRRHHDFAPALATRGSLYLVQARATKNPNARTECARKAKESFDAALARNRYLSVETEEARKAVEEMLE